MTTSGWWQAECARLRADLEATERARQAAEDERDTVLELVADDAVDAARARDDRDAARLHAVATLRVALADAEAERDEARAALAALAAAVREERSVTAASEHAWASHITADDLAGAEVVLALDARLDAARAALDAALGRCERDAALAGALGGYGRAPHSSRGNAWISSRLQKS